jgi:hypothetical protein
MRIRTGTFLIACTFAALSGCNFVPTKACENDDACLPNGVCDPELKECVAGCDPECSSHFQCVRAMCLARYSGIELVKPNPVHGKIGGSGEIQARLVVAPGREANLPQTLTFEAESLTPGGTTVAGTMTKEGDVFIGAWQPTNEGGDYRLTVRYPDAGLEKTFALKVDTTKPVLTVVVPASGASGIYADPGAVDAYKRHEKPKLFVTSTFDDVDVESLRYEVRGFNGTGVSDVGMVTGGMVKSVDAKCNGAAFCAEFEPELWKPEMKALRADFAVAVTGADKAGNAAAARAEGTMKVTRVRWMNDLGAPITGAPGIESTSGRLFVGTSVSSSSGRFVALEPDGSIAWDKTGAVDGYGGVAAAVVVGSGAQGAFVYGAARDAAGVRLIAVSPADGSLVAECPKLDGPALGPPVFVPTNLDGSLPSVVTTVNVTSSATKRIATLRPGASDTSGNRCSSTVADFTVPANGLQVTNNSRLFVGDTTGNVHGLDFAGGDWNVSWTVPVGTTVSAGALLPGTIHVGSNDGVAAVPTNGGSVTSRMGAGFAAGPAVINAGSTAYYARGSNLMIAPLGGGTEKPVSMGGPVSNSPVLGADGLVYVVTDEGFLNVLTSDGTSVMSGRIATLDAVTPPQLDCSRDAGVQGGILYFGATNGLLYSIDVDSRGIDTTAPWPKFQHDPRNTGNSSTDLTEFACP